MQLFCSTRSPYVRKVLICAHETGVFEQLQLTEVVVSTFQAEASVVAHNPLGQIPTLVRDDGTSVFDSGVICAYLHELNPAAGLVPASADARLAAHKRHVTGDGMLNVLMRWYGERRRDKDPASPMHVDAFRTKFNRIADAWEADAASLPDSFDIGQITIACALAYADFRFAAEPWRNKRPQLERWFTHITQRTSFQKTAFK
jgi:glutathione S-transferase